MAKIILRQKEKSIALSVAESILLGLGELGSGIVESFFPKKYAFTRPSRILLGFDQVRSSTIRQELRRLQERGLVAKETRSGQPTYTLTPQGRTIFNRIAMKIARPDRSDGNLHVVIFDIPERLRKARNVLRYELEALGFQKLQASVWVSRYPVTKEFYQFLEDTDLVRYTILLKVTDSSQIEKIKDLCNRKPRPKTVAKVKTKA